MTFYYNPSPPVEFYARGLRVRVAWPGGGEILSTGNSFATPHIAGICSLILSKHRSLTPFQLKSVLYLAAKNVAGRDARREETSVFDTSEADGPVEPDVTQRRLLQSIVEVACRVFGAAAASVFLVDRGTGELVFEAVAGEGEGCSWARASPAAPASPGGWPCAASRSWSTTCVRASSSPAGPRSRPATCRAASWPPR
nr:hypothetical protein GCM10020093_033310 [Planobispora longispora]